MDGKMRAHSYDTGLRSALDTYDLAWRALFTIASLLTRSYLGDCGLVDKDVPRVQYRHLAPIVFPIQHTRMILHTLALYRCRATSNFTTFATRSAKHVRSASWVIFSHMSDFCCEASEQRRSCQQMSVAKRGLQNLRCQCTDLTRRAWSLIGCCHGCIQRL